MSNHLNLSGYLKYFESMKNKYFCIKTVGKYINQLRKSSHVYKMHYQFSFLLLGNIIALIIRNQQFWLMKSYI